AHLGSVPAPHTRPVRPGLCPLFHGPGGVLVSTHTGGVDARDEFLSTGGVDTQPVGDELPGAIEGPAAVASRRGFPGPIAFRQLTPGVPGRGGNEDGVVDLGVIAPLLTFGASVGSSGASRAHSASESS